MNQRSTFERATRVPLRLLTAFGGAEIADRLGLREPSGRALHRAAKAVAQAGTAMAKPARPKAGPSSPLFDLTPTEEQAMLRDVAKRFADEVLRPAASDADEALAPPAEVLAQAQALGLAGLVVPEELGGTAEVRASVAASMVAEELARGDMGLALAILAPLGVVTALVEHGTRAQQEEWLPILAGESFVAASIAILEGHAMFDPMRPRTGAIRNDEGGFTIHGEKVLVPMARASRLFVVAADIRGAGPKLFLVPRDLPGVTVSEEPSMGLRAASLGRVRFDGVKVGRGALLGGDDAIRELDFGSIVDRARVAWGAMAVGASQAVLEYTMKYASERKAFGEPITNRQAVAFLLADMAIEIEGMRLMVQRAASLSERRGVAREASLVRTQCASKAMKIGSDGVQILGGHGFVKDHPVERWYRDLRSIGVLEGAVLA